MDDANAMKLALEWMTGLVTKYDPAQVTKIIESFTKVVDHMEDWDEVTKVEVGGLLLKIFEQAKAGKP